METSENLNLIAARIQAVWEANRICRHVGRGCWARVVRIACLVEAGQIDLTTGLRLASEAEGVVYFFAPLPTEPTL